MAIENLEKTAPLCFVWARLIQRVKIIVLIVIATSAVMSLMIIVAVFYLTSGVVKIADCFFVSVKNQQFTTARGYLSDELRASTDEHALKAYLLKSSLLNFKKASWNSRRINNGRGELEGSVFTETGGIISLKLTFVKEDDIWKIYAIQKIPSGIQS